MKRIKHLLTILLISAMMFLLVPAVVFAAGEDYAGKIIILHTNDVHGAISSYQYVAGIKQDFLEKGAEKVILVDAGDYLQGSPYVSESKGASAINLMNEVGYDLVTLGNHEFDYGYPQLLTNLATLKADVIASNLFDQDNKPIEEPYKIVDCNDLSVGFVGVVTPETKTNANPIYVRNLQFLGGNDMYACVQSAVNQCSNADIVIAVSHLGIDAASAPNRSTDLYANVSGIDFIIDGHSHSVITIGPNDEPIQSTGTALANVGAIVIDEKTKTIEDNYLIEIDPEVSPGDEAVEAMAKSIIDEIDAIYGVKFAETSVKLDGVKENVRSKETNLGDLISDAMRWYVLENSELKVDDADVVAITNGGGIRADLPKEGNDISRNDVHTVLPFGNTLAVIYVKGSVLLEALEASSYCTPEIVGGFPQIAGMKINIDTTKAYDPQVDPYPGSTYFGPESINRVTIKEIGGNQFDPEKTYAVVTNNFCAAGGDTYYAFASTTDQFDTGFPLDEVLVDYIIEKLKGEIGKEYQDPAGRITNDIIEILRDDDVAPIPAMNYTGDAITPEMTVSHGGKILIKDTDYSLEYENNREVGMASVYVLGKGDYSGKITCNFDIMPVDMENVSVDEIPDKGYTGYAITPDPTITFNGITLMKGMDYTVSASDNLDIGEAKLVITGMGNFTGSINKTFNIVLAAPALKATASTYNSAKLSWNRVTGANGYMISRATEKTGTYKVLKTIAGDSTVSYIDKSLSTGTVYYYNIKAYRTKGDSQDYSPFSAAVSAKPVLKATTLNAKKAGSRKIKITWKKVAGASGYVITRATSKTGKYKKIKTITKGSTLTYTNTKLKARKTYYYKIKPYRKVNGVKVYGPLSKVKYAKG